LFALLIIDLLYSDYHSQRDKQIGAASKKYLQTMKP